MLLSCDKKGCYAQDEHLLDLTTGQINCTACGEAINLPPTTKNILKTMGQVRRTAKSGIQVKCKACGQSGKPLLKTLVGGATFATCRKCDAKLDVHPSFVLAMKEIGNEYTVATATDEQGDG